MNVCECVWKAVVSEQGTSSVLCMKVGEMFWNPLRNYVISFKDLITTFAICIDLTTNATVNAKANC